MYHSIFFWLFVCIQNKTGAGVALVTMIRFIFKLYTNFIHAGALVAVWQSAGFAIERLQVRI